MSKNMFAPNSNYINSSYLRKLIKNFNEENLQDYQCNCFKETINKSTMGSSDSTKTAAWRISQILTLNLGGRTAFGNNGIPATFNYLGGINGQPGGTLGPIRNKF
jgi:hypothetical protein